MTTLLLAIIYFAFISLGLPDTLLGVSWPIMQVEWNLPISAAGPVSILVTIGTVISSLLSGRIIKRIGTGRVTFISVAMTCCAMFGFYFASSYIWLFILAVPLGLGAGAVDSGLNNYVATHYKARHMSWLHCFWGIGATSGPIIMSVIITKTGSWRSGYLTVACIQLALVVLLFATIGLWDKVFNTGTNDEASEDEAQESLSAAQLIRIKGVAYALLTFLFYCGVEITFGLWGSSFLVGHKQLDPATAAQWVSFYYGGITIGRFITGFVTVKLSNVKLIRLGQLMILVGVALLLLPLPTTLSLIGFVVVGLGCSPIFPCMIHETPVRFGRAHSQSIIGFQIAFAYLGSTFLPPLFGLIASRVSLGLFPLFVLLLSIAMLAASETVNALSGK